MFAIVCILRAGLSDAPELLFIDEALAIGNLLNAGDIDSLALLDDGHELSRLEEAVVRTGIQPDYTATHALHGKRVGVEVRLIDRGDLKFPTRRGLDSARNLYYIVVIEVEAGHRPVGLGVLRLLLQRERLAIRTDLDHAKTSGVVNGVAENHGSTHALDLAASNAQDVTEAGSVEDIVTQNEGDRVVADEVGADDERLSQTIGMLLHSVGDGEADLRPITEELLKGWNVSRGGDDKNVSNTREHKCREWVVNHRLVIDGKQLFGNSSRCGKQPRTRTACENDALHTRPLDLSQGRQKVPSPLFSVKV